jgi:hypothetical protein
LRRWRLKRGNDAMRIATHSAFIAATTLLTAFAATAQTAAPSKSPDTPEIIQIIALKKLDPATFELFVRTQDGKVLGFRMNTFVAQDLSRQLGNFNR